MRIGNWPLLMMVLEHVIRYPGEYDQTHYVSACGTVRCIAGWAAHFGGYRTFKPGSHCVQHVDGGIPLFIEDAALAALRIDPDYDTEFACEFFDGTLTFDEVLERVQDVAKLDGVTLTPDIQAEMRERGVIS